MTRGKQIIEEAKRIIAEAHERGNNDPMVDLAVTLSFALGARWADKNPHWISIEDSLPKEHQWFLGYSPMKSAMLVDVYNFDSNGLIEAHCITHWMPLPQAPKKGGNQ
jgi:hypothetical protein